MSPGDSVTVEPNPALLNQTEDVTFTCGAMGGPGNSFQWSHNGQDLSGETTSTLTLTNISASDDGNYTCTVSNSAGSGSNVSMLIGIYIYTAIMHIGTMCMFVRAHMILACVVPYYHPMHQSYVYSVYFNSVLTVGVEFTDFEEPSDSNVELGQSLTLICTVTGSEPITYQWFKDGSELPGETEDMLPFMFVTFSDFGTYHCVVNNSVNTIQSREAVVTGLPPCTIVEFCM